MINFRILFMSIAVMLVCVACKMAPAKDENYLTSSAETAMTGVGVEINKNTL